MEVLITMENIQVGDRVRIKGTEIIFKIAEIEHTRECPCCFEGRCFMHDRIISEDTGINGPLDYSRKDLEPVAGNWWTSPKRRIRTPQEERHLEALEETRLEMMEEEENNEVCSARGHNPCDCELSAYPGLSLFCKGSKINANGE